MFKLTFIIAIIVLFNSSVFAQDGEITFRNADAYADINLMIGGINQNLSKNSLIAQYNTANQVNAYNGNLSYVNGLSLGCNLKFGYFINDKKTIAIESGLFFMSQQGFLTLDSFHTEYKSTDKNKKVFRQVLTGKNIVEQINAANYNIPIILHLQKRSSKKIYVALDAGILVNVGFQNNYNSNASFNYEAIYSYGSNNIAVYDASPKPSSEDVLLTYSQFVKEKGTGTIQKYFDSYYKKGYNVGWNVPVNNNTGKVLFKNGSIGYIIEPSLIFHVKETLYINAGIYYISQSFTNYENTTQHRITDVVGSYNTLLSNINSISNTNVGVKLGFKILLGSTKNDDIRSIYLY